MKVRSWGEDVLSQERRVIHPHEVTPTMPWAAGSLRLFHVDSSSGGGGVQQVVGQSCVWRMAVMVVVYVVRVGSRHDGGDSRTLRPRKRSVHADRRIDVGAEIITTGFAACRPAVDIASARLATTTETPPLLEWHAALETHQARDRTGTSPRSYLPIADSATACVSSPTSSTAW
jgi:hypothetical protein